MARAWHNAGSYDNLRLVLPMLALSQNCRAIMAKRDSKGNIIGKEGGFFALQKHMMRSKAWRSLSAQEVAVFIRVAFRYKGDNNGELALSARDAALEAKVSKNTAAKALRSLCNKGLLKLITPGGYSTNGGKASEYALTCVPISNGKPASREYQDWKPPLKNKTQYHIKDNAVPNQGIERRFRIVT